MSKHIVVIGGGIAGLATAALCAQDGHSVTLLEKNKHVGGRAMVFEEKGYTFDMGPSWYMMPDEFDRFFALFGKKPSDYMDLHKLKTHYKIFYSNGETITITDDLSRTIEIFNQNEHEGGKKLQDFLASSRDLYAFAMKDLVRIDYDGLIPWELAKPQTLARMPHIGLLKSYHQKVASSFKDRHLQKLMEFMTVFLGGSPFNTPAFYSLMAHADFDLGIWYPMGGIYKLVEAFEKLCKEKGVIIKVEHEVQKIEVVKGRATRVMTSGGSVDADVVVCAADYAHAETKLLEKAYQTYPAQYWKQKTLSPSALLIYLGLDTKLTGDVEHHSLYLGDEWEKEFERVYKTKEWSKDPSYYMCRPTKTDATIAPDGTDILTVLVPVAPGLDDSDEVREAFANKVLEHIERIIKQDIRNHIVVKRLYSHRDFIRDYYAYEGSAFGIAHTLLQTAIFRPRNMSAKVKNLYYAGQYTNPGIGLPIGIISAQIVHNLIQKHESNPS